MIWLRKALAHLALSRSNAALIAASGGEARTVRGMTLDPRLQFLEATARKRGVDWTRMTPAIMRGQLDMMAVLFGGDRVREVRRERIFVPGRSHSTPCRLYLPRVRDNNASMLVYFHSGGGVIGSLESCDRLCALIAKYSGAPVLSVEYRLAPEHKFPAGLDDAFAVYAWALENASRYGAPTKRVGVGGDSMGGGFAAVVAQMGAARSGAAPALQLLIYPVVDWHSERLAKDFADAFPLTQGAIDYFAANYLPEGADLNDQRISPDKKQDLSGLPQALVYTAGFDMLLDQGEAYADRLQAAGVRVVRARFDSLCHGFVTFPSAAPAVEAAVRRIARETALALKGK